MTAPNEPDEFILALVEVPPAEEFEGDVHAAREPRAGYGSPLGCRIRYVRTPFQREPDFDVTSVNYLWKELWERGADPLAHLAPGAAAHTAPVAARPSQRQEEFNIERAGEMDLRGGAVSDAFHHCPTRHHR